MINFLKVSVFSLLMVGGFWGFSNFGIPQIKPAPPPVEEKLDLGAMTMDQFIALGGKIFNGKGTCTLCHNAMGRAPMLDKIGTVAPERMKDARYKGTAKTVEVSEGGIGETIGLCGCRFRQGGQQRYREPDARRDWRRHWTQ